MKELRLRGQVAKYEPLFIGYVKNYGSEVVAEVLRKGHSGKYRLKILNNRKDRHQMLQLLGLEGVKSESENCIL